MDQVKVEQTTLHAANRKVMGAFKYALDNKQTRWGWITAGILIPVLFIVLDNVRGTPAKEALKVKADRGAIFSIPTVTGNQSPNPDAFKYDRAREARELEASAAQKKLARPQTAERMTGPKLIARPRNIKIPPGTFIKAELVSGASNGLVKAILKEPISINGETLADAGMVVIGQGNSSDDRLSIRFTRLVSREGVTDTIDAQAADLEDKTPGLKGSKVGAEALKLVAGIGLNFVGGMSEGLQEARGEQGVMVKPPTVQNALLQGAARASIDESRELLNDARNAKPRIEVGAGTEFYLLFSETGGQ